MKLPANYGTADTFTTPEAAITFIKSKDPASLKAKVEQADVALQNAIALMEDATKQLAEAKAAELRINEK